MNCEQFLDKITENLDDILSQTDKKNFREHHNKCAKCAKIYKQISENIATMNDTPDISLSSDFRERLNQKIYATSSFSSISNWTKKIAIPLAAVLILGLSWIILRDNSETVMQQNTTTVVPQQKPKISVPNKQLQLTTDDETIDSLNIEKEHIKPAVNE